MHVADLAHTHVGTALGIELADLVREALVNQAGLWIIHVALKQKVIIQQLVLGTGEVGKLQVLVVCCTVSAHGGGKRLRKCIGRRLYGDVQQRRYAQRWARHVNIRGSERLRRGRLGRRLHAG